MPKELIAIVLFVSSFAFLQGQAEQALKDYFEGAEVVAKMDLPGDKSGVDIRVEDARRVDYAEVGKRLKRYGISIRRGDPVMVTLVKVNKRNIEFQLGGGGFGTFGDPTTTPSISTYVPKSEREKRLEEELKKEKDPRRKRRLEDELDELRHQRQREEARLEAEAAQAQIMAEARAREMRMSSGSRFNLWFDHSVPAEALTPEAVKAVLSEYLDFTGPAEARTWQQEERGQREAAGLFALRKGVSEQDVNRAYGQPVSRKVEEIQSLTLITATYELEEGELWAQFVEGVLVKYSMFSK